MTEFLFYYLLRQCTDTAVLILFLLILRIAFRKKQKKYFYISWKIVFLRLLLPFTYRVRSYRSFADLSHTGTEAGKTIPVLAETQIGNDRILSGFISRYDHLLSLLWILGMALFCIILICKDRKLRKKIRHACLLRENIYICEKIGTAFVYGLSDAKIYLPSDVSKEDAELMILHEKNHIRRRDNVVNDLSLFLLTVYWFDPLVWICRYFLLEDMEESCDEDLLNLGVSKTAYCNSLLSAAYKAQPLTVGYASGIERRLKNIMNYRHEKRACEK